MQKICNSICRQKVKTQYKNVIYKDVSASFHLFLMQTQRNKIQRNKERKKGQMKKEIGKVSANVN